MKLENWKNAYYKYSTTQVAVALSNLSSDRIKYDHKDKKVNSIYWMLESLWKQGEESQTGDELAVMCYDVLYNIARRYYENKLL